MTYLAVEEYHARLHKDGRPLDGKMWLRAEEEWEVEAGEGDERLAARVHAGADMSPRGLFCRVVENLASYDLQLNCCGTCANFRRSPHQEGRGWMGYCSYRGADAAAPAYPGEVALLAPDCHAYQPGDPDQPVATVTSFDASDQPGDPESTRTFTVTAEKEEGGMLSKLRSLLGLKKKEQEMVRAGVVERPGGQPCPACGTRMTNRASVANADPRGEERVLSVWNCPHCGGNYLDDWFEAYVGSRAHDAERLYVVPPVEANAAAAIVVHCPRPDVKGCTCIANQHFDRWGNELEKQGRRIKHRESVVSL
jgi:hypothetical protein